MDNIDFSKTYLINKDYRIILFDSSFTAGTILNDTILYQNKPKVINCKNLVIFYCEVERKFMFFNF